MPNSRVAPSGTHAAAFLPIASSIPVRFASGSTTGVREVRTARAMSEALRSFAVCVQGTCSFTSAMTARAVSIAGAR